RGGLAIDPTPTDEANRTPRIPDNDRLVIGAGASWKVNKHYTADIAYNYIDFDEITYDRTSGLNDRLLGTAQLNGHILGIGLSRSF
ncbi:MAG: outer membrane protein transport protein, partial [Pseudomonadota bacterium]